MNIRDVIAIIPKNPENEALMAVESVTIYPANRSARLTVHLSVKFWLYINAPKTGEVISIEAEGHRPAFCTTFTLLSVLKHEIYEIDEAIAAGRYRQTQPKMVVIDMPTPPPSMDIPV